MALTLRYTKGRTRDCAWIGDPALLDVPETAKADWRKDGAAAHLRPFAKNGDLTVITIRDLTPSEVRYVKRHVYTGASVESMYYDCFVLAARFKGAPEAQAMPDGTTEGMLERNGDGFVTLSDAFITGLDHEHPGLVTFFGELIFGNTWPKAVEKKASSPPSTETPSSAAGDTSPSTEGGSPAPAV